MEEFDSMLVRHCSPTLAGIKTGSLFSCSLSQSENLPLYLKKWNNLLNPRGVVLTVLNQNKNRTLIYVYRPKRLGNDLISPDVQTFLSSMQYDCSSIELCLKKLVSRIRNCVSFPHEIGLFLGYPLHDVIGFIENCGQNCKCCGLWKVYCDECQTMKMFDKFKKCTLVYSRCFQNGSSIKRLTVAA